MGMTNAERQRRFKAVANLKIAFYDAIEFELQKAERKRGDLSDSERAAIIAEQYDLAKERVKTQRREFGQFVGF